MSYTYGCFDDDDRPVHPGRPMPAYEAIRLMQQEIHRMENLRVLNENTAEFEAIVQQARCYVPGHLGDVREWHGIDRYDADYFNPETGRGASDDDILDNVRDDVFGDLLNHPDYENIAAESLSDAASHAVHEYITDEKLGRL